MKTIEESIKNPLIKDYKSEKSYSVYGVGYRGSNVKNSENENKDVKDTFTYIYFGVSFADEDFLSWKDIDFEKWIDIADYIESIETYRIKGFRSLKKAEMYRDVYIAGTSVLFNQAIYNNEIDNNKYCDIFKEKILYILIRDMVKSGSCVENIIECFKVLTDEQNLKDTQETIKEINRILKEFDSKYIIKYREIDNSYEIHRNKAKRKNRTYDSKLRATAFSVLTCKDLKKNEHGLNDKYLVYRGYYINPNTNQEETFFVGYFDKENHLEWNNDKPYKWFNKVKNLGYKVHTDILTSFSKEEEASLFSKKIYVYYDLIKKKKLINNFERDEEMANATKFIILESQFDNNKDLAFILSMFNAFYSKYERNLLNNLVALSDYLEDNNSKYIITQGNGDKNNINNYGYRISKE